MTYRDLACDRERVSTCPDTTNSGAAINYTSRATHSIFRALSSTTIELRSPGFWEARFVGWLCFSEERIKKLSPVLSSPDLLFVGCSVFHTARRELLGWMFPELIARHSYFVFFKSRVWILARKLNILIEVFSRQIGQDRFLHNHAWTYFTALTQKINFKQ
jgi:hypothetical protein